MKLSMLIGEPCVGKSSIMRAFLETGNFQYRKDGGLPRHEDVQSRTVVFGRYDEECQFPGTDRLSMGIKPIAMEHAHDYGHKGWHVIWEGARISHNKTIRDLLAMGFDVRLGVVIVEHSELTARRVLERSQTESFIARQCTTVRNTVATFPDNVTLLRNDVPADLHKNVNWLRAI